MTDLVICLNGKLHVYREFESLRYCKIEAVDRLPNFVFNDDGDFIGILIPASYLNDLEFFYRRLLAYVIHEREGCVMSPDGDIIKFVRLREDGVIVEV